MTAQTEHLANEVNATGAAINWLLSARDVESKHRGSLLPFIVETFNQGATVLGYHTDDTRLMVCEDVGFELVVNESLGENTLHPKNLEGAGEITQAQSHLPFLMMLKFQHRIKHEWAHGNKPSLTLCDEQGNVIEYRNFNDLKALIERMNWDYATAYDDAVLLGLAMEAVKWSEIKSEIEDCYF